MLWDLFGRCHAVDSLSAREGLWRVNEKVAPRRLFP
jgi:hypothetical protein